MKLRISLILCLYVLSTPVSYAQQLCGFNCTDFSLIVAECDPVDLSAYYESEGCSYKIYDHLGNLLPNPVPINANTACIPLKVVMYSGTDTCIGSVTLKVSQYVQAEAPNIENVSYANYAADRIPLPEVTECIGGDVAYFATDEIIGLCNQVPRIKRTWKIFDQCQNPATVSKEFNLVGYLQCHIIGADRVGIGQSITVRSNINLRHINPFQVKWIVIGDGWSINVNKLDPSEATLTPGNIPGNATVMLDLFDKLGCVRHCERVFTSSYKGRIQSIETIQGSEISVKIRSGFATIHIDESVSNPYMEVIDYMGKTYNHKKLIPGWNEVPIYELNSGLYYIKISHQQGIMSKAFIKS